MAKPFQTMDVANLIADETGITRPTLKKTADVLRTAGLLTRGKGGKFGAGAVSATPRDAAILLLAALTAPTSAHAVDATRIFSKLKLIGGVQFYANTTDKPGQSARLPHDHPDIERVRGFYPTFLDFLEGTIERVSALGRQDFILSVSTLGWSGTAKACVSAGNARGVMIVEYGGSLGRRPDDAPRCRIERTAKVSGQLLMALGRAIDPPARRVPADKEVSANV